MATITPTPAAVIVTATVVPVVEIIPSTAVIAVTAISPGPQSAKIPTAATVGTVAPRPEVETATLTITLISATVGVTAFKAGETVAVTTASAVVQVTPFAPTASANSTPPTAEISNVGVVALNPSVTSVITSYAPTAVPTEFSYLLTDLSGNTLAYLPFTDVRFSFQINGSGSFTGTLPVNEPAFAQYDWQAATMPWRTCVWVFKPTRVGPLWGGVITNRSYSYSTGQVQVRGIDFWGYFNHRLQAGTYSTRWATTDKLTSAITIAIVIIDDILIKTHGIPAIAGLRVLINTTVPVVPVTHTTLWTTLWLPSKVVHTRGGIIVTTTTVKVTLYATGLSFSRGYKTSRVGTYTAGAIHGRTGYTYHTISTYTVTINTFFAKGRAVYISHWTAGPPVTAGWFRQITETQFKTMNHNGTQVYPQTTSWYRMTTKRGLGITFAAPRSQQQTVSSLVTSLAALGYRVGFDVHSQPFLLGPKPQAVITLSFPYASLHTWHLYVNARTITFTFTETGQTTANGVQEMATGFGGVNQEFYYTKAWLTYGYPRLEKIGSRMLFSSNQATTTVLRAWAIADLQIYGFPTIVATVTQGLTTTPPVGTWIVGDTVILHVDPGQITGSLFPDNLPNFDQEVPAQPRFPRGLTLTMRIVAATVTVTTQGLATVKYILNVPPSETPPVPVTFSQTRGV